MRPVVPLGSGLPKLRRAGERVMTVSPGRPGARHYPPGLAGDQPLGAELGVTARRSAIADRSDRHRATRPGPGRAAGARWHRTRAAAPCLRATRSDRPDRSAKPAGRQAPTAAPVRSRAEDAAGRLRDARGRDRGTRQGQGHDAQGRRPVSADHHRGLPRQVAGRAQGPQADDPAQLRDQHQYLPDPAAGARRPGQAPARAHRGRLRHHQGMERPARRADSRSASSSGTSAPPRCSGSATCSRRR